MDQLPTAMMGFGLGLLTASLATAVVVGTGSCSSSAALAQEPSALAAPQPATQKLKAYPSLGAHGEGCRSEAVMVLTTTAISPSLPPQSALS